MQILKQKILGFYRKHGKASYSLRELSKKLGLSKEDSLEPVLRELELEGELAVEHRRYFSTRERGYFRAKVVKINNTYGFVQRLDQPEQEIFIPGRALLGALPDDIVLVRPMEGRGELPEGEITCILEENNFRFSGVFTVEDGLPLVTADRNLRFPILVAPENTLGAETGNKVMAEICHRGDRHFSHRARILKVFGRADSAKACCQAILESNEIEQEFSKEILAEAEAAAKKGIPPKELEKRLDLRFEPIFTIDGADTKDIDDAISVEKTADGWNLGVHIADVSYYVGRQSELDKCAYRRGTSVYYADSVIPMLPKELSNGICSLNPDEDRLAFSALMTLDSSGELRGYRFVKTVIRSKIKGVYQEINQLLAHTAGDDIQEKYRCIEKELPLMEELAEILTKRHFQRGSVDLESTESKILLDEEGRAIDVLPRTRGKSEQMIEEFMLMANEAAARFGEELDLPFLYRIHEEPPEDRIENLKEVLDILGVDTSPLSKNVTPEGLASILNSVKEKEIALIVNQMLLRSMAKARYSEQNKGHFGLVLKDYTHFTSPIRRYPDLVIHRILSDYLSHTRREKIESLYREFVREAANRTSDAEIRAMTAERSCEDCYKAEYISQFLGDTFEGVITSVKGQGIYVELANTVEGLVRPSFLPEGEYVSDEKIQLENTLTGKRLRIGDTVTVKLIRADISSGQVDFSMRLEEPIWEKSVPTFPQKRPQPIPIRKAEEKGHRKERKKKRHIPSTPHARKKKNTGNHSKSK